MHRAGAFLAALILLSPLAATASQEGWVQVAFVHPHPPRVVTTAARDLFVDVNAARAQRGLALLTPDARLDAMALAIARQMAERRYFGHTDPNGVTFEDRLRAAGFSYRYAAENMALDSDEPHANAAFLNSPEHFRNIVDVHERRLGVAAVEAADGETFYVEEFSD
jgi:uncharacterized protein YkwD